MAGQRVVNLAGGTSCTISGNTLTVGGIITGIFSVGMTIAGPGVTAGTTISSFGTGTGGAGNYTINTAQTISLSVPITATGLWFTNQTVLSFTINGANAVVTLSSAPALSPSSQLIIGFTSNVAGDVLTYDSVSSSWKNVSLPTSSTGNDVTITYVPTTGSGGSFTTAIQAGKITNTMVSSSAAIVQSKLSMFTATTRANATSITQAERGLASFDSTYFTADTGWISLTSSSSTTTGIPYTKIRYVSAGAILGNLTASATTIQEVTTGDIVTSGDGIKNASFGTAVGVMTVAGGSGARSYSVTAVTTTSAASSLVKTGTDKSITADSLKIGNATALSIDATYTTQLNLTTPGGVNFLAATGSTGSNAVTTLTGTFDATLGTIKVDDITTGASATEGQIVGNWKVQPSSNWDVLQGTLKSTTLTAGANSTNADITGNWRVDGTVDFINNAATLKSLNLTTGATSTAGDLTGAWTVKGGLTMNLTSGITFGTGTLDISSDSSLLKVRHISTGLAATTGDFVGTWTVKSGSTLVASTVVNQGTAATLDAESSTNTENTVIKRGTGGNFTAGTMTGTATKANNLTGGNATTLLGSIPYQSAADATTLLAPNISVVKKYLTMTGNDTNGAAPVWSALGVIDAAQTANTVYTGPSSGSAAVPTFRSLVSADIPSVLTITELKANTLTANNGGSGLVKGTWTLDTGAKFEATYADLAEYYEGDQEYDPGTVLVFGGEKEVTTTTVINDTRSAGVVTTNPAYVMNNEQTGIKVCIALAGRVPVKVVGRVKKGDMLTTAATPGYAVKALSPTLGAIIGKALEDKDYGEAGVIQVAVGRV
jgi:hypothetical protein